MTFLVTLALAIGLLVAAPLAAHFLRRGPAKERPFPPANLVAVTRAAAPRRSQLEDRALLAVRALLVLGLAVLGATPLVTCSRLSLARHAGASVAFAVVIDDSLSMQASTGEGSTRFEQARSAARDLLRDTREGDAVALILAGRPARVRLAATTQISTVVTALESLLPGDRDTDIQSAVKLARGALSQLPHADKRVILLSDLAGEEIPEGAPEVWTPLPELQRSHQDCGIIKAERRSKSVSISVACNHEAAGRDREVALVARKTSRPSQDNFEKTNNADERLSSAALAAQAGSQTVRIELERAPEVIDAFLTGTDDLLRDDFAPVVAEASALNVGVVSNDEPTQPGGVSLLERALSALDVSAEGTLTSDGGISIRPLSLLPDNEKDFAPLSALILDDPAGITPEARGALITWLKRGKAMLALLGPRAEAISLGASHEPYAHGAVHFVTTAAQGTEAEATSLLGEMSKSLAQLSPKGRADLQATATKDTRVLLRWDDEKPFLIEQRIGKGLCWTASLPSSERVSDFALRPGFLALLDALITRSAELHGQRVTPVGKNWAFSEPVTEIIGPDGATLPLTESSDRGRVVDVGRLGRYAVRLGDRTQQRIAVISAEEVLAETRPASGQLVRKRAALTKTVDVSAEIALILLALMTIEIALRALRGLRLRRAQRS